MRKEEMKEIEEEINWDEQRDGFKRRQREDGQQADELVLFLFIQLHQACRIDLIIVVSYQYDEDDYVYNYDDNDMSI